ncbi:hypothetical protein, conserved [Babesia bigemina]|uniref:Uncharacterized protein n=1 Tax=Babesia bigemina TaxID=5866 RepID=A0A061D232_BABBI|nr:hypothetical protein, conserved [Babesia bigemina]CDR94177.1 hypothetical protein, conserved [Babesia bigemina]|eukprot:XP_012766363.1 hypothetical protein, conserved [Babesia bigemina]
MDFYISSLAARIPCTRLHRQVQDPRGRPVAAFAISRDGRLAAMATYPREYRSVERSVNVLFKDGKALRTSNYHKAVQRQRRLTEQHHELEYNVEQYIRHSLQMDTFGSLVEEVAMSTPSLSAIIRDNNPEPAPEPRPIVPCAVVIYDTMYFNPVEEFVYGYKLNDAVYMKNSATNTPSAGVVEPSAHLPPHIASAISSKCLFRPTKMSFVCNDSVLVISSPDDGAKLFSMDTEYVELLCHFRPQLRDDVNMESLKILTVNVVMADLTDHCSELPSVFVSPYVFCHACQQAVLKDVEACQGDAVPYTVVIECVLSLSSHPPLRMVLHSRWPSGDVAVHSVHQMYPYVEQLSAPVDYVVSVFRARLTDTEEFDIMNRVHTYWAMEPYMHDKTEFLIHSDKPIACGYTKTLLASKVNSRDYLEDYQLIAMYTPDSQLYVMDTECNVLGQTEVHNAEEGFFTIDVDRTGSMIALIGTESIFVYRLHVSRDEDGAMSVAFQLQMKFPHVVGVGRREEILSACLGRDLGNRWMYVSVARGSVDAVMYVVDVTPSKGKDPIKRTLNMNSVIFPCITDMVALEGSILLMPRHQRFLVQLTQEHLDSTDDTYSRQFCHFPLLSTNKEALMLNSAVENCPQPAREKFEILLLERERQISSTMRTSNRLSIGRWLDALYQYNALCMYKGRGVVEGMDPHDYLLPPLRRTRQQFPFGYDAKQFYDPLLGIEFTGSPALMRAQCYEWARDVITRSGFINPLYPMEVVYDDKLQMLDYVCAKICISQWDNPADILFSMRSNDFLRLQLCNFLKISQRLELPCDAQGMIPCEKTMIFKKVSEVMPQMLVDGVQIPVRQSRASLEREAFEFIRQQLVPELVSIPANKLKKIIRDRLYRLRKKLTVLERYKQEHDLLDVRPDFTLDEIARNDCRLPTFRDSVDTREVLLSEFAMRVRIKVLTTFYKAHKDGGPDLDEFDSS